MFWNATNVIEDDRRVHKVKGKPAWQVAEGMQNKERRLFPSFLADPKPTEGRSSDPAVNASLRCSD